MKRIDSTFSKLQASGRKALVGYLTAGYPDMEQSEARIREAVRSGLDVLELGVPFSDPTADGPVIQSASFKSLAAGTTVVKVLGLVRRIRAEFPELPVILFGYANPFFVYGYEKLAADAADAGADGFLVVDLPYEEADEFRAALKARGLCFIPLVAPTTGIDRAKMIADAGDGFVYYISVTGVTGTRSADAGEIAGHVRKLKAVTRLPVCVGFGVNNGTQARAVGAMADGVVVGSALIRAADEGRLGALVKEISGGLRGA